MAQLSSSSSSSSSYVYLSENINDYDVGQTLGRGGFAIVYRARERLVGKEVAIKIIRKITLHDKTTLSIDPILSQRVENEVKIHSKLSHENIINVYTVFEDNDNVYIVMELCLHGNLYKHLKLYGTLSEFGASIVMKQLLDALAYMHSNGIVHRDLKLSNILIADCNDYYDKLTIKICDFGLAIQLEHPDEEHFTICGTPNYIAPEVALQSPHGLPADLWSVGCLFYSMLVGTSPFETGGNVKETLQRIVTGNYAEPSCISDSAKDFMQSLLNLNPSRRAKVNEILAHPFLLQSESTSSPLSLSLSAKTTASDSTSKLSVLSRASIDSSRIFNHHNANTCSTTTSNTSNSNSSRDSNEISSGYGDSTSAFMNPPKPSQEPMRLKSRTHNNVASVQNKNLWTSINNVKAVVTATPTISVRRSSDSSSWLDNINSIRHSIIRISTNNGTTNGITSDSHSHLDILSSSLSSSSLPSSSVPKAVMEIQAAMPSWITDINLYIPCFKYCDKDGNRLIISAEGDVCMVTTLSINRNSLLCKLLVRRSSPRDLLIGSVDESMRAELLQLFQQNDNHFNNCCNNNLIQSVNFCLLSDDSNLLKKYNINSIASQSLQRFYLYTVKLINLCKCKLPRLILYLLPDSSSDSNASSCSNSSDSKYKKKQQLSCKCMLMGSDTRLPDYRVQWVDGTILHYSLETGRVRIEMKSSSNSNSNSNSNSHSSSNSSNNFLWQGLMNSIQATNTTESYGNATSLNPEYDDSIISITSDASDNSMPFLGDSEDIPSCVKPYLHIAQLSMQKCLSEDQLHYDKMLKKSFYHQIPQQQKQQKQLQSIYPIIITESISCIIVD